MDVEQYSGHVGLEMAEPEIQILEQPRQRGTRFYFCSEGIPKHIPGERSSVNNRTYPSILIHNYRGKGRVRVTLVTKNEPYRPHPYNLSGRDCKDGHYEAEFGPECSEISFKLAVRGVMRKYVKDAIMQRIARGINPFNVPREQLLQTEEYDLKVVRLCIQVFLPDDSGHYTRPLGPIVTNPIYAAGWDGPTISAFKEKEQNKTEVPPVNSSSEKEEDVDSDDLVGSTEKNPSKRKMSRKQSCDTSGEGISSKRCFSSNEPDYHPDSGPSQPNMPSQEVEKLKSMRSEFIKQVSDPVLNRLLYDLLDENVLNDEEMTSVRNERYREVKARLFIDMVKKKGDRGCSKMIDALYQEDPTLYEELGLSKP